MLMNRKRIFKPVLAFLLAFVTLMGAAPLSSFAQIDSAESEKEEPSPYIYIDGERVLLTDKRIQNTVTVPAQKQTKAVAFSFAPMNASALPNVSSISGVAGDFERDPNVTMGGKTVSA